LLSFGGRADDDGDDGWARRRHEAVAAAESLVACLNWSNSDEKPDIVAAGAGSPRGRAGWGVICGFSGGKKTSSFIFGQNIAHIKIAP
jgi:hypothetical protein